MTAAAAPKKIRTQGRPDSGAGVGRDALVAAAIEELRTTAPEALTLRGVAARADVHPALIRYYFGNKDGLLREVVQTLVDQAQAAARASIESNAPVQAKLAQRLNNMIDLTRANPHFHRLVLDKVYGQADANEGRDLLDHMATRGMRLTVAMLHDEPAPALRQVDPRFLHVAMIGLTEFFAGAQPLLQELFGDEADFDDLKKRYVAFLSDLILHGIAAPAEEGTGSSRAQTTHHEE